MDSWACLDVAIHCQARGEVGDLVGFGDHDVAIDHCHLVSTDRELGRRGVHASRAQVKAGCVERAFDPAVLNPAVGRGRVLVRAGVVNGKEPSSVWKTAMGGAVFRRSASPGASSLSGHALCMEGPLLLGGALEFNCD